jgi:aminopeptidase N
MGRALNDQAAEPAFKALMLSLPSENDLALAQQPADPTAIHEAREALKLRLSLHLNETLKRLHTGLQDGGAFSPDAASAGRRALRNAALDLLAANPTSEASSLAEGHYRAAGNMTDAMGGLSALMAVGGPGFETALADFFERWKDEALVLDKWFALQARDPGADALERVEALTRHSSFDQKNPNRLRALVSSFASFNPARFHAPDGSGYRFLADQILAVDSFNPMTAARLVEPLGNWRRYVPELGNLMRQELDRIAAHKPLSKNVTELVGKALAEA